jgi:hypothetical protein
MAMMTGSGSAARTRRDGNRMVRNRSGRMSGWWSGEEEERTEEAGGGKLSTRTSDVPAKLFTIGGGRGLEEGLPSAD